MRSDCKGIARFIAIWESVLIVLPPVCIMGSNRAITLRDLDLWEFIYVFDPLPFAFHICQLGQVIEYALVYFVVVSQGPVRITVFAFECWAFSGGPDAAAAAGAEPTEFGVHCVF